MPNNKLFTMNLTRYVPLLLSIGLLACAQAPEKQEISQVVEAEPEAIITLHEPATPIKVQRNYPERYIVKKGDTLWDIAKTFLKDPWLWPQVWHINPDIRNPHLIFPGDVLVLYFDENGKPYITLDGAGGYVPPSDNKTIKLSPAVHYETLDKSINTIPRSAIAPFLGAPRIISESELEGAPYIVSSFEQHLISGTGTTIYAKDIKDQTIGSYDVVRPKGEYRHPETGELLGYEVIRVADTRVVRFGQPASTLSITKAYQEVFNKDLLIPKEEHRFDFNFFPRPPIDEVNGQIIDVFNGVAQIGQFNVVVLDLGSREGMEPGHVLAIYQKGERVRDPDALFPWTKITLPDERGGILMIFKVYEKLSYALVMEAQRALHINDQVTNP